MHADFYQVWMLHTLLNCGQKNALGVLAQRESIYRLLTQITPESLCQNIGAYSLDPTTRYRYFNKNAVKVHHVKHLLDSDDATLYEQTSIDANIMRLAVERPHRKRVYGGKYIVR